MNPANLPRFDVPRFYPQFSPDVAKLLRGEQPRTYELTIKTRGGWVWNFPNVKLIAGEPQIDGSIQVLPITIEDA
jgi:hypothetical protein